MNTLTTRRLAAMISVAGICLAAPAYAQEKTVKIGVLNDMSSLYADIGGPNSVVAIKMAVEDSGLTKKGWKIEIVSGDHQNDHISRLRPTGAHRGESFVAGRV